MKVGESFHLTYCSNIHPGETWAEVRDALSTHLPVVRDALSVDGPFAIGLRLSADAAETLERPDELSRFREFLADGAYYVFTINGFPHGRFHGERIKERVYRPDWLEDERLLYTNRLARILAAILPDDSSVEGSVSTVPGAFKPRVPGATERRAIARRLLAHVDTLRQLRDTTGKTVRLALEPEPCCHMETVAETVDFFERRLLAADARRELQAETGISLTVEHVQRHLGVCYDACHMAVEFEEPAAALRAFREAGVPIAKVQISAALRLRHRIGDGRVDRLTPFAEPTYLHQVVGRGPDGLVRHDDLPPAIAAADGADPRWPRGHETEWRVHFHVPVFLEAMSGFETTQDHLRTLCDLLRREPACPYLEVETYTWDVLPEEHRLVGVTASIARELAWVRGQLTS